MKNIVILGAMRSGKTTFSKMILEKYKNYNLVEEDVISEAYYNACAKSSPVKDGKREVRFDMNIARILPKEVFEHYILCEPNLNFIYEGMDVSIKKAKEYKDKGCVVIVFGYPNITSEIVIDNIRKHDTVNDWSYHDSDYKLSQLIDGSIKISKTNQEKCQEFGIKFVDTSYDRNKVLDDLMKWLDNELSLEK